jgi:hypothetical protein
VAGCSGIRADFGGIRGVGPAPAPPSRFRRLSAYVLLVRRCSLRGAN